MNNIVVRVTLLSDLGGWDHDIIIREFKTIDMMNTEIQLYNELERRTINFPRIHPAPMINIDKEHRQLVYEYNNGMLLEDIDIAVELKHFLVGRIYAMLQGDTLSSLDADDMRELFDYLLENLPLLDDEQEKLSMLLEPHYLILPNCMGGYRPCTLFDPDSIEFTRVQTGEITIDDIKSNSALALTIPMQQTESLMIDRMADLASMYFPRAYEEFKNTGNVLYTQGLVKIFFEGYNSVSQEIGIPSMSELYPHGITLDLQMLVMHWITKYQEYAAGDEEAWSKDDIRFSYFLLLKKPFLIF